MVLLDVDPLAPIAIAPNAAIVPVAVIAAVIAIVARAITPIAAIGTFADIATSVTVVTGAIGYLIVTPAFVSSAVVPVARALDTPTLALVSVLSFGRAYASLVCGRRLVGVRLRVAARAITAVLIASSLLLRTGVFVVAALTIGRGYCHTAGQTEANGDGGDASRQ